MSVQLIDEPWHCRITITDTTRGFMKHAPGAGIEPGDWVYSPDYPDDTFSVDRIEDDETVIRLWSFTARVPVATLFLARSSYLAKAHAEFERRFGFPTHEIRARSADRAVLDALRTGRAPLQRTPCKSTAN